MSWLLFIVYTILFFGLVYMLVKKLIAAKSTEKKHSLQYEGKRSLADSIYPAILPLVITFSMQIYGAQHSLLLLSAMMLTSGIREF